MPTAFRRISKRERYELVKETTQMIERGTPENVIYRRIMHLTGYSLSGARQILKEAAILANVPVNVAEPVEDPLQERLI